MRLDKFLTEVQIGSRSQVKDYIKKGRISVNQVTVLKPEAQIKENSDTVTFDGKELQYSQFHYYMLHKPAGVITAVKDDKDVTVMSLLPRDAVGQMNNWVSCCQSCGKSSFPYAHMEAMPYLSVFSVAFPWGQRL